MGWRSGGPLQPPVQTHPRQAIELIIEIKKKKKKKKNPTLRKNNKNKVKNCFLFFLSSALYYFCFNLSVVLVGEKKEKSIHCTWMIEGSFIRIPGHVAL
jgi:hypothetical protein